ncbi:hypothetical protein HY992_03310 [Candidatus Micrarchaeota archaeon]|nr:hypothetical protein [Candidatus Micrarchaeota archaeon]
MVEDDSNISRFPSGYKRKKPSDEEASPPLVLSEEEKKNLSAPSELMSEKPSPPPTFTPRAPVFAPHTSDDSHPASKLPLLLAAFALIIAFVSIGLTFTAFSDLQKVKVEAKGLLADIRSIQDTPIQFKQTVSTPTLVSAEIPLSKVFGGSSIPVSGSIPISGVGKARSPTLGVFDVQLEGEIPVNQQFAISAASFSSEDKLVVNSTIPLSAEVFITVKPDEFWGDEFDDIANRLEKISK